MRSRTNSFRPHALPGFTLVELLVVIGVIALLIALLLPSLGAARESANRVKCLANLRSMAQAAHLHAAEHRGYMPFAGVCNVGMGPYPEFLGDKDRKRYLYRADVPVSLPEALGYYMGLRNEVDRASGGITPRTEGFLSGDHFRARFTCPSQAEDAIRPGYTLGSGGGLIGPRVRMSYVFNGSFLGRLRVIEGHLTPGGRVDRVSSPASVFLFADGKCGPNDFYSIYVDSSADFTLGDFLGGYERFESARHRRRVNVVFVDGHAETLMMHDATRPAGRESGNVGELDRAWVTKGLIFQ